MTRAELIFQIEQKKSLLCVGLDSDVSKLPPGLSRDAEGVLDFNKRVIEATKAYTISYKINTAFYEALGADGWKVMEETLALIPEEIFTIADAKRGDIGNTANQYAIALLEKMNFDAITLNPYMGMETLDPYMEMPSKWGIVLGLTSNPGSADIEKQKLQNGKTVYEHTLDSCVERFDSSQMMMVMGATHPEEFKPLRERYGDYFFLVPGVGAQGGDLEAILNYGLHPEEYALLISVSRAVIFAGGDEETWESNVASAAEGYQQAISDIIWA